MKTATPPANAELLTVKEAATFLRTSPDAIYARVERGQLPGVVRDGRRLLFRAVDLRRYVGLVEPAQPSSPPPKAA